MKNEIFEKKIKPLLLYIGTIGAIIMIVCYIITVCILVFGFKVHVNRLTESLTFAIVNGIVGFLVMQMLKIQGVDFAKNENKELLEKYNAIVLKKTTKKTRKYYSIEWYWIKSVFLDFIVKSLTVVISSFALIYIVVEGSQDYSLLLLAVVNLLMFICFGMLSLVRSYEWYNYNYVNYMQIKIDEVTKNAN